MRPLLLERPIKLAVVVLWLMVASVGINAASRVSIRIVGSSIVCTVPYNPTNRWLDMGIAEHATSTIQLFGNATDPVETWRPIPVVTCEDDEDALVAFCLLSFTPNGHSLVRTNLLCR